MASASYRFEHFLLDVDDRQLRRNEEPVELNARYLDALALLVREQGRLVSKDRFMDEVWRGVPVTDEALTQCIRTLRRQLGDDAANPRFIETVPKHGYRFVAPVRPLDDDDGLAGTAEETSERNSWQQAALLAGAGTIGGGLAGLLGGLLYGFVGSSQPLQPGLGAASVLLVLVCLCILVALIGAAGVSTGIAIAGMRRDPRWAIVGGAAGGLIVGAFGKLIGLDAFNLLVGQSPGDITGGAEGVLLGGAVGLAVWLGARGKRLSLRRSVAAAALIGLSGGELMAGSLDLLAQSMPGSRLHLDWIGRLIGESDFGPASRVGTCILEGALFAAFVTAAMVLARRTLSPVAPGTRTGG